MYLVKVTYEDEMTEYHEFTSLPAAEAYMIEAELVGGDVELYDCTFLK